MGSRLFCARTRLEAIRDLPWVSMKLFPKVRSTAAAALLALMAGCSTGSTVRVPRLPEWRQTILRVDSAYVRVQSYALARVFPDLSDESFTTVSYAWLQKALPWSAEFLHATGVAYVRESFDCDKFAKALSLAAEISASRAGVKAQPLVARIYVQQHVAWGGIPAGGGHALVVVATDRGLFVVEPQTRTLVPFTSYPNREYITAVKIGG